MDTPTNTALLRGDSNLRDRTAPRRAYLDTYAKHRSVFSQQQAPVRQLTPQPEAQSAVDSPINYQPTVAIEQPPVVAPMQPAPAVVAVPIVQPVQVAQPAQSLQPKVVAAQPNISQPVVSTVQQQSTEQATSSSHKTYLDTLTRRHQQAVAASPARLETVYQPAPAQISTPKLAPQHSQTTQNLLSHDEESEKRLEANLRALYEDQSLTAQIAKNARSASAAHIRTIVGSALACGILAMGIFSFASSYDSHPVVAQPIGSPVIEVEAPIAQPGNGTPVAQNNAGAPVVDLAQPVRLVISSIGVNAPVEGVGITPQGLIGVPKSYGLVGWYNKAAIPGKKGPAILVGHYTGGSGGVFDKLQDLNNGDLVTTTNGRGESVTFKVTAKNVYDKDKVPMAELLKPSDDSKLQIITCTGKWQAQTYNQRLVVTAEIVK